MLIARCSWHNERKRLLDITFRQKLSKPRAHGFRVVSKSKGMTQIIYDALPVELTIFFADPRVNQGSIVVRFGTLRFGLDVVLDYLLYIADRLRLDRALLS